jgi:hypothetical protein
MLAEQRKQLDTTLAEQAKQLDRTLAEQRTRALNERNPPTPIPSTARDCHGCAPSPKGKSITRDRGSENGWELAERRPAGLPPAVLQEFINAVREGAAVAPIGAVYQIDQIVEAHTAMEEGRVAGKIVVLT